MRKFKFLLAACAALVLAPSAFGQINPAVNVLNAFVGDPYSLTFSCPSCAFSPSWSIVQGSLPSGLTLDPSTGTLSGVPTATQSLNFVIQAAGISNFFPVTRAYTFQTFPHLTFLTGSPLAPAIAGTSIARSIQTNMPVAWSISQSTLPSSISISLPQAGDTATLTGSFPLTSGPVTYTFQLTAQSGNVLEIISHVFSITVTPLPTLSGTFPNGALGVPYSGQLTVQNGTAPFSFAASGLPPGLTLNPATGAVTGTPTQAGTFTFGAGVTDRFEYSASSQFTVVISSAPVITTTSLPQGQVGQPYTATLTETGGTPRFSWSIAGALPPGLTLDQVRGIISGVPTTVGTTTFTASVSDANSLSNSKVLSIVVGPAGLTITTTSLPNATAGASYNASLAASGGNPPYSWSVAAGALPPGLTLSSAGAITGTLAPAAIGVYTFTAQVTDTAASGSYAGASASRSLSITVGPTGLSVITTSLPSATAGANYSSSLAASGGNPPYSWSVSSGALPPGLTLSTAGAITGTLPPAAVGVYTFTAQVTDTAIPGGYPGASASRSLSITVNPSALTITTTALPGGTAGAGYTASLAASGGNPPYSWSLSSGALPPGLTLSPAGAITGTLAPAAVGVYTFTAQVTDTAIPGGYPGASASRSLSITVNPSALTITTTALPGGTAGASYTASLAASGGNPPYSWSLSSGALPPGLTLSPAGAITGTLSPAAGGVYPFTAQVADTAIPRTYPGSSATRNLSITVSPNGLTITTTSLPSLIDGSPYSASLAATGGNPPYLWSLAGGQLPPGLTLGLGGSITGTPSGGATGTYTFTVQVRDSSNTSGYQGSTATRTFTLGLAPAQLSILTPPSLPSATLGQVYTASLRAAGGNPPYAWTLDSGQLPPGFTLSPAGVISGYPQSGANTVYTFTARVTDTALPAVYLGASVSRTFFLAVNPGALTITSTILPGGVVAQPYSAALSLSGGTAPYTWKLLGGALPDGISLLPTGTLTGTPTTPGNSTFTVGVSDAQGQSALQTLSITVTPPLTPLTASLPDGEVQVQYNSFLGASGGTPAYVFTITAGSLPPGLTLNPNGALTGTPTAAGSYTFTATVTDALQAAISKSYTLVIAPPLSITSTALPAGTRNAAYSAAIALSGGSAPYVFTLRSGSLPPGLTLSNGGTLSGTPTATGTFSLPIHVTDSAGGFADATLSLFIGESGPSISTTTLPGGLVGVSYLATLGGQGVTPLTWSLASGALPAGLTLNPVSGVISGVPTGAGQSSFIVRVADSNQPSLTSTQALSINIQIPALPSVSVTQLPDSVISGSQPVFGITLGQAYPIDLTGTATLSFQPISGPGDPAIVFPNNATTLSFTVPAGQLVAIPPAATPFAFQTGTTAGTILIAASLSANGQTLTPNPAATQTIVIPPAAPVITSVKMAATSTGLNVLITGFSNTREIVGATFAFTASADASLAASQFSVPVASTFQTWWGGTASAPFGGQFQLTVPFSVSQGAVSGLTSVRVTLTNTIGSAIGVGTF